MPRRNRDTVTSRPDLGFAVKEYMDEAGGMGYIGLRLMPIFGTAKNSSTFPVIPKKALLSMPKTDRAPRSGYPRDDWDFEAGFYACREHGFEALVDDSERAMYKEQLDVDEIGAKRAAAIVLRRQEFRIAAKTFNPAIFTGNAVTAKWNDPANAVPITDIKLGKIAIRNSSGVDPRTLSLAVSYSTFEDLKSCAQIVDRLKYTFPGIDIEAMGSKELARIFDVAEVLVGGAVYDSGKSGQSATVSSIWNNQYAMLTKVNDDPVLESPCLGRTFLWTDDSTENTVTEQYRADTNRSDVFRVRQNTDERLIQSFHADEVTVKSNIAQAVTHLFTGVTA